VKGHNEEESLLVTVRDIKDFEQKKTSNVRLLQECKNGTQSLARFSSVAIYRFLIFFGAWED
jgi:hypothetical protein